MTLNERDDGQLRSSQGEYFPEDMNGHAAWPEIRSYIGALETGKSSLIFWIVAPRHMEASQTRDQIFIFCTGRWILNQYTREVPQLLLNKTFFSLVRQLVGSYFPYQASNPSPCIIVLSPNHWTTREFHKQDL